MTFTPSSRDNVARNVLRQRLFEIGDACAGEAVLQRHPADLFERLLGEVRHEAGVGAVLDDGRRPPVVGPPGDHVADAHVPYVERAIERMGVGRVLVGIPHLDRRVEVAHAVIAAPFEDGVAVDVPRQVEQDVARADVAAQHLVEVVARDVIDHVADALGEFVGDARAVVDHVEHGDARRRYIELLQQQGQRALRDRPAAEDEDPAGEASGPPPMRSSEWRSHRGKERVTLGESGD